MIHFGELDVAVGIEQRGHGALACLRRQLDDVQVDLRDVADAARVERPQLPVELGGAQAGARLDQDPVLDVADLAGRVQVLREAGERNRKRRRGKNGDDGTRW